jgi:hypothetical protein
MRLHYIYDPISATFHFTASKKEDNETWHVMKDHKISSDDMDALAEHMNQFLKNPPSPYKYKVGETVTIEGSSGYWDIAARYREQEDDWGNLMNKYDVMDSDGNAKYAFEVEMRLVE